MLGIAVETTGSGVVSDNTFWNFTYSVLAYQSAWNIHNNTVYNDGSGAYYGFANNGSGSGIFGPESVVSSPPGVPAQPTRVSW
jgi:hypothetical protein